MPVVFYLNGWPFLTEDFPKTYTQQPARDSHTPAVIVEDVEEGTAEVPGSEQQVQITGEWKQHDIGNVEEKASLNYLKLWNYPSLQVKSSPKSSKTSINQMTAFLQNCNIVTCQIF